MRIKIDSGICKVCLQEFPRDEFRLDNKGHIKERLCQMCRWDRFIDLKAKMGNVKIRPSDKAFSLYIRTRDKWTCQRCGAYHAPPTSALHCSHFQGRGKEATRFEPLNCDALCYGCHRYFTSHPGEHYNWQVKRKGQQAIDMLILQSNNYKKRDDKMECIIWRAAIKDLTEKRKRAKV